MAESRYKNIDVCRLQLTIIKALGINGMALKLSPLDKILTWMVPKSLTQKMVEHGEYTNAKLARRLDRTDGREDL